MMKSNDIKDVIPLDLSAKPQGQAEVMIEEQIPRPVGYHLLIAMPKKQDTFGETGIMKIEKTIQHETILSMVGVVLDMGAQAYSDDSRFPTGPWCKTGDYVIFRPNSGTRFKVAGQEYRILNDDSIEATVGDPNGITPI